MSRFYSSSDYAGLCFGDFKFYYGYERTLPHDEDEDAIWCFEATRNGKVLMLVPWTELPGIDESDSCECSMCLMAGIGMFLEKYPPHIPE